MGSGNVLSVFVPNSIVLTIIASSSVLQRGCRLLPPPAVGNVVVPGLCESLK